MNEPETMTVTVRDRSAEAPWGVGLTNPVTRKVVISAFCPVDGQRRGEPRGSNECDDGAFYWVQVWNNPCGHVDSYADVVKEAAALSAALAYPAPGSVIPPEKNGGMTGYVVGECGHRVFESEWRAGFRNCERCGINGDFEDDGDEA